MKGKFVFYLDLFRKLDELKVRYLLVGGVAMNLHGVPRMTMDVDIVLAMDDENLEAFIRVVSDLGLKPQLPIDIEMLKDADARREWVARRNMIAFSLVGSSPVVPTVDVLIHHPLDFDSAYRNSILREADGVQVRYASIEDMIRMKENTGRRQDAADIEQLQRFVSE